MSTITSFITPFTTSPSRQQPLTFSADMDTRLSQENSRIVSMNAMGAEMNTVSGEVNTNASNTLLASAAAVAAANFQGTWTSQTTIIGQSWEYSGVIYGVLIAGNTSPVASPSNWFALTIAQSIKNTPAGNISATTVQAAINELDTEKAPKDNPIITGTLAFEGATVDAFQTVLTAIEPTADNIITIPNKTMTVAGLDDILAKASGVRQTVQSASVDANGYATFISIGTGLAVNIAATTTPIVIHVAGGAVSNDRIGTISADTSIAGLTANSTNYLYADVAANGTVTLSANVVAHLEQFGGTPAVTNNLLTFNIGEMKGYTGNGATAPQTWRVPIGECITGASTVTSVVNYALNGVYDSGWTATLPAIATYTSKNHNLGTYPENKSIQMQCTTADLGYSVGAITNLAVGSTAASSMPSIQTSKNAMGVQTGNANGWLANIISTGGLGVATATSWKWKFFANRGW